MKSLPDGPQSGMVSSQQELVRQAFPWLNDICRHALGLALPAMAGKAAYVVSDYGGEHAASDYSTIGILWANFDTLGTWEKQRRLVREQFLRNNRRMEFKSLGNDKQRKRALTPFLLAANHIDGICMTVAIRKSIKHLCTPDGVAEKLQDDLGLQGKWKPDDFERLGRVAFAIVALVAALSSPGQEVCWISDEDSLFANLERQADVARILRTLSQLLVGHAPGQLSFATTKIDPGDRREEDLAAITDLVAGATAEAITAVSKMCGGGVPSVCVELPRTLSWKSNEINDWLFDSRHRLKRLSYVIDQRRGGGLRCGPWQIS